MYPQTQFANSPIDYGEVMTQAGGEMLRRTLQRYVYLAGEDLNVADRRVSVKMIPRARLTPIRSVAFMGRVESEAIIMDEDAPLYQTEEKIKRAADSADELERCYSHLGLIQCPVLNGAKEEFVREIESVILPTVPDNLLDLKLALEAWQFRELPATITPEFKALLDAVASAMLQSTINSLAWQTEQADIAETEVERRALPGGVGRPGYTPKDLHYFKQLKRTPKNSVLEELAKQQREALTQMVTRGNQPQVVATQPEHNFADGRVPCVACAEQIQPNAKKCHYCGEFQFEVPKKPGRPKTLIKRHKAPKEDSSE
jgi:hypothetical protein